MVKQAIPLDMISVASPCQVSWDDMRGDERVRFCGQCQNHVYDLSALTRIQAEQLITETEGRVCVRYYRRHDGTVMTRDCPKARETLHRIIAVAAAALIAALFFATSAVAGVFAVAFLSSNSQSRPSAVGSRNSPVKIVRDFFFPPPPPPMMGAMCPPAPPAVNDAPEIMIDGRD